MKKNIILTFFVGLLTIGSLLFISQNKHSSKPEVLVTIAPYKYFVERLTENKVRVKNLVPEVADPHGFEPATKELVDLFSAKIWFLSGEPFEKQFTPILKKNNPQIDIVSLDGHVDLLKVSCCSHHHVDDLHFWMSPKIAKMQCQTIARLLKEHFPEYEETVDRQLEILNVDFERLDAYLSDQLKNKEGMSFLVSHPAFGYFAKEYHLHQLALENEGQDPTPRELSDLLIKIKENQIQNLYVQKQYNYKASEQLAKSEHLNLIEINPYAENYFENMREFGSHLGDKPHD
ncbi:MAG: High-affinity zinc uptake system binding-protein ZnuA [Chlamydiae bacterium]|nr:High-affinity zinc uptake system binding-protein ZnuA [Chlamydiota bacterium]